ncbi:MAG: hypothetical protein ACOC1P_04440 [Minisyncoccales bacterium]
MAQELEEGDTVLCTVDRIIGTTVFVKIHLSGEDKEGSMVFSEVAPGRIRNIRNYVVPKKKIVCKILRISPEKERIDLSLRRVTPKEHKEVMEEYKQERSYKNILKSLLGEKTNEILKEINSKDRLYNFIDKAKENPKELENLIGEENSQRFLEILNYQKKKKAIIKKEFSMKTSSPEGINLIKKILSEIKNVQINYISAGKYSLSGEDDDIKKADKTIKEALSEIEKKSKKNNIEFTTVQK